MLVAELNKTRRIGCEYELAVPIIGSGDGRSVQDTIANILTSNGIRACSRSYSHSPLPPNCDIAVETDSSISGENRFNGVRWAQIEVKTKICDGVDEWENLVPKTLEILRYCGGRITPSCGHHIHLSFDEVQNPRTVRSLWNLFHRFDNVIFGLVAPSRRNNSYCRPMPSNAAGYLHGVNSIRTLRNKLAVYDRYMALNLTHIWDESPHLELRHHQGTLNVTTARMWLRFCLQVVQHSCNRNCQVADAPTPNDRRGIEALLTVCGFKVNTKVYCKVAPELRECGKHMLKRWKHFNGSISLSGKRRGNSEGRHSTAGQEAECAES